MENQGTYPEPSADTGEVLELILFVAGKDDSPKQVTSQVNELLNEHLAGRYHFEVVDVISNPIKAYEYNIIATPTLLRWLPKPVKRVIGDLSQTPKVLSALGLSSVSSS